MPDITLTCKDCNQPFVFSEGEQKYYQDRGLAIPKRCSRCRLRRRSALTRSVTIPREEQKPEPEAKKEEKETEKK